MSKQALLAFKLYGNIDHSDNNTKELDRMTQPGKDLDIMFSAIRVPVVYSTQSIDYEFIANRNPALLKSILSNPNISFTMGTYTHLLPSIHPESMDLQLAHAAATRKKYNIQTNSIFMLPEFDMFSGLIPILTANPTNARYVLLHNGVTNFYDHRPDFRNNTLPANTDLVTIENKLGQSIRGIVTQGPAPRNAYLGMLRGYTSPKDVVACLISESIKAGERGSPILPVLVDLEAVQLNQTPENNSLGYFVEFMSELEKAKLPMIGFDQTLVDILDQHFDSHEIPKVDLAERAKPKWIVEDDKHKVAARIKSLNPRSLDSYFQLVTLAAQVSDYYSAQITFSKSGPGVIRWLPAKLADGTVLENNVILRSDGNRMDEVRYLVDAASRKVPLNELHRDADYKKTPGSVMLSPESIEKMSTFHEIFKNHLAEA